VRDSDTLLTCRTQAVWRADAEVLPIERIAVPADWNFSAGRRVDSVMLDNCFDGWRGAARIRDEKMSLQLTSSLDRLVVYTPQQRDYYCVEPVSHLSNAIHMADPLAHGLKSVAPSESAEAWMQLDVGVL
jgi:aldose 1-epimerase